MLTQIEIFGGKFHEIILHKRIPKNTQLCL